MRILQIAPPWFCVPPLEYGGTELVVAGLCDELVAAGHEVVLAASGGSVTAADVRSTYPEPPSAALGDAIVELPHALAAYRDRHSFDVVHDHTAVGVGIGALLEGPPIVHTVHGAWTEGLQRLYRAVSPPVHLVAISRDHAQRRPPDLALAGTVSNGLPIDDYPFTPRSEGYLAWLGRAGPDKGADVAVKVARRLGRHLRLAIKVNEPEEHRWWQEVLQPQLGDVDVEVILNAPNAVKLALLGGAEVVLFPIRWEEPFGLVMVEANACGTPVAAFARGAAPEVLADGYSGVLVPPGDVTALCEAVERAATLDRRDCRRHAADRFGAARMARDYLAVYAAVGAGSATPVLAQGHP